MQRVSELDSILTSLASTTWSHGLFRRPSRIFKYNWETTRLAPAYFSDPGPIQSNAATAIDLKQTNTNFLSDGKEKLTVLRLDNSDNIRG